MTYSFGASIHLHFSGGLSCFSYWSQVGTPTWKKGQSRYVQVNTAPAWPTRHYRQALHSAEPGERESLFLSPPSLVSERGELAKRSVKNLGKDALFKCSSFVILLPQNSAFPDLLRSTSICRKLSTGTPNGSPPIRGVWGIQLHLKEQPYSMSFRFTSVYFRNENISLVC